MTFELSTSSDGAQQVLALHGVLDAAMAEVATDELVALDQGGGAMIVDLSGAVLASPAALVGFVERLCQQVDETRIGIVCDRLSGRRLLRVECPRHSIPLFTDLNQALARSEGRPRRRHA